jgi:hypothetical protein
VLLKSHRLHGKGCLATRVDGRHLREIRAVVRQARETSLAVLARWHEELSSRPVVCDCFDPWLTGVDLGQPANQS